MRAPFSGRAFDELNCKWYLVDLILIRPGMTNKDEQVDCLAFSATTAWSKVADMLGDSGVVTGVKYMGTIRDFENEHGAGTDLGLDFTG